MKPYGKALCLAAVFLIGFGGIALGQEERTRTEIRSGQVVYASPAS